MRALQLYQHFPLLSLRHRDPNIPVHRHRRSWQGSLALFPSCRKRWYSSWFRDPYASRGTEDSWLPSRKFPFVWIHQQRRWFFPCHQILAETSWPFRAEKSISLRDLFIVRVAGVWKGTGRRSGFRAREKRPFSLARGLALKFSSPYFLNARHAR